MIESEIPGEAVSWSLAEALRQVIDKEKVSFHMPGHRAGRGWPADLPSMLARLDTTELAGTDNLHNPTGVLRTAAERAARHFGAGRTYFLVNGSTVGLLAMIHAAAGPGDTLLVVRDCHLSVLHALQLAGVQPCFVEIPRAGAMDLPCGPSPEALEKAVLLHPHARGLLVTRPNYYGLAVSLEAISTLLHSKGMLLLVDEAHGAHFAAGLPFPSTALSSGADLVVQSLHKTLPAPTQTALLHEGRSWPGVRPGLPVSSVAEALSLFQTTSPSYPLLACIDAAVAWAASSGRQAYDGLIGRISAFRREMASDSRYHLSDADDVPPGFEADPARLVVFMENKGIELERMLREIHGIVAEMADMHKVVLITTPFHDEADFRLLSDALKQAPDNSFPFSDSPNAGHGGNSASSPCPEPVSATADEGAFHAGRLPERIMTLRDAVCAPREQVPLSQAAGRVAAKSVVPYPPGIAVIVPGERYECERVKWLSDQSAAGISMLGMEDGCVSCVVPV